MSHLVEATRQMALVARAGHPLGEALRASAGQSRWLARVADQIEAGDTVAQAMRRHPRVFSPFYTSMVEAAEASENPADLLGQLSRWLERADSA
ncbi:MAG TPA: type II secretion system F family protein, partial [Candidatus Nitrosotenuis sp.]|nr:type II secretion system F family protein [Candidatus Nitrosotenuis sp.]